MSAIRIIDDHIELDNIGSNSHAQIDTHISTSSIHQTKYTDAEAVTAMGAKADANPLHHDRTVKYTDAEAVTALATADKYLKNYESDTINGKLTISGGDLEIDNCGSTGEITFRGDSPRLRFRQCAERDSGMGFYFYTNVTSPIGRFSIIASGKLGITNFINDNGYIQFRTKTGGSNYIRLLIENDGKINIQDNPIKNPKNHAATALSGTKKLVEIDIGGNPYYFEVYPTKA